eukprot:CAMPEP_0194203364 /NCGR_PEP_ID=MMETSP0156-20130528/3174_1 /TAXON_ID=33649 /ORGANISM="Thalassionema nitzschioides, Strain L26-B" /LENGTH=289 /DNA_ID=CAMNT_0038929107 /DNA_START=409 /DNA_END=1278 /DNA_ORIENTATION=+
MTDGSDLESIDDLKTDADEASQVLVVEMPLGGIVSSENIANQPSVEGGSTSASNTSFSFIEKVGGLNLKSGSSLSSMSSYVAVPERNSSSASVSDRSLISSFEIVSLSSGKTALHCKWCKSRHQLGTRICNLCYLALCANHCQNVDQEIVLALQKQEEEAAYQALKVKELKCSNIFNESSFAQAEFLSTEILLLLGNSHLAEGLNTFSQMDLTPLASGRIPKTSIAYLLSYKNECNQIRLNGFAKEDTVQVRMNIEDAVAQLQSSEHSDNQEESPSPSPLAAQWSSSYF